MDAVMEHPNLQGAMRWILLTSTADWLYEIAKINTVDGTISSNCLCNRQTKNNFRATIGAENVAPGSLTTLHPGNFH